MRITQPLHPSEPQAKPLASIVLDSVNETRSAKELYGSDAEPDWHGFLREASAAANVIAAVAVVNNGVTPDLWNRFLDSGYSVKRCTNAPDCDELVIAEVVRTCYAADIVVIGGGDWKYTNIAIVLRQMGKRVIVAAVRGSVSHDLLAVSHQFVDFPVTYEREATPEDTLCAA